MRAAKARAQVGSASRRFDANLMPWAMRTRAYAERVPAGGARTVPRVTALQTPNPYRIINQGGLATPRDGRAHLLAGAC